MDFGENFFRLQRSSTALKYKFIKLMSTSDVAMWNAGFPSPVRKFYLLVCGAKLVRRLLDYSSYVS